MMIFTLLRVVAGIFLALRLCPLAARLQLGDDHRMGKSEISVGAAAKIPPLVASVRLSMRLGTT
jgi:hypothetical protein